MAMLNSNGFSKVKNLWMRKKIQQEMKSICKECNYILVLKVTKKCLDLKLDHLALKNKTMKLILNLI